LLILFAAIAFLPVPGKERILALADLLLFFVTGLLGLLLVFMWTGTDHVVCRNNFNLLWALPTNAIFAFLINKRTPNVRRYFLITSILAGIALIGWYFLPQRFNPSLFPVVILMAWRSWKRASA
jgi:hypothetical protein